MFEFPFKGARQSGQERRINNGIIESGVVAFATLFVTVGPIDVAATFAAMTARTSPQARVSMAVRGALVAAGILLFFGLVGRPILAYLGISLAALRTAAGLLLFLIAIDMVFARVSGGVSTTADETREASAKTDISVFPLATPLLAGPGSMGAITLLMANTGDRIPERAAVLAALLAVMGVALLALLAAARIHRILGVTGLNVITRISGVVLSGLAVQFVFDGILESGLV